MFPKRSVKIIDDSEKRNRQLAFELQNSHVCEKHSNIKKLNFILFKTKQNRPKFDLHLSINDIKIDRVNEVLFLGVVLDEHLSWKSQIQNVERKVSTESVGIIYKLALIRSRYVLSIIVQFILINITVPVFGAQLISQILSV